MRKKFPKPDSFYSAPKYLLVIFLLSNACGQKSIKITDHGGYNNEWLNPGQFTPLTFIDYFTIKNNQTSEINIITLEDSFPEHWVKIADIEKLIPLIRYQQKCNCMQNPFSSIIRSGHADVGGYAILFINSFRKNEKIEIGLYNCPCTDEKSAEDIEKWWNIFKLYKTGT